MNNNFKPLAEQVAEKFIEDLMGGTSILQQPFPADQPTALPYNPSTGKTYKGPTALVLLMQNREDPRWMTVKQASFNQTHVIKDSKGTLINFYKSSEMQPETDGRGEPVLKENGKLKFKNVKLEKPALAEAWLFNGEQLKDITTWRQELEDRNANKDAPLDRLKKIVNHANPSLAQTNQVMYYNAGADKIEIPGKGNFKSETAYYTEIVNQMISWSGHESRLNRFTTIDESGANLLVKESLRREMASLMLGKELNTGYQPRYSGDLAENWVTLLKKDPGELFKAAAAAQKIVSYIGGFENELALSKDIALSKANSAKLIKGEIIPYNDTEYKIESVLKKGQVKIENLRTGEKHKIDPADGLYASLLSSKNNPRETNRHMEIAGDSPSRENNNSHSLNR